MDYPSQPEPPQHGGEDELQSCGDDAALNKLAQSGDEETANGGNHVAGGTLSWHGKQYTNCLADRFPEIDAYRVVVG